MPRNDEQAAHICRYDFDGDGECEQCGARRPPSMKSEQAAQAEAVATDELIARMLPGALLFAEEVEHLEDARRRAKALLIAALATQQPSTGEAA